MHFFFCTRHLKISTFSVLLFICRIDMIRLSSKLCCFDAAMFVMVKIQQWCKLLYPVQPSWAATVLTESGEPYQPRHRGKTPKIAGCFFFFILCIFIIVWCIKPGAETNGFKIAWPPKPPPPPTPHTLLYSCWAKLDKFICCQLPLNLRLVLIPAS